MTRAERLLCWALRTMDALWPGWSRPAEPAADHLSHESYAYWLTKMNRRGDL